MKRRRHKAIAKAKRNTTPFKELKKTDPKNDFVGYTIMMRGGIGLLSDKQNSMMWEVAMLANDYERLRRFIH